MKTYIEEKTPWNENFYDLVDLFNEIDDDDVSFLSSELEEVLLCHEKFKVYSIRNKKDDELLCTTFIIERGIKTGYIYLIHTVQDHRGKGYGKQLIDHLKTKYTTLSVVCSSETTGPKDFYVKNGFELKTLAIGYYSPWTYSDEKTNKQTGNGADGLCMVYGDISNLGNPVLMSPVNPDNNTDNLEYINTTMDSLSSKDIIYLSIFMEECEDEHYDFDSLIELTEEEAGIIICRDKNRPEFIYGYCTYFDRKDRKNTFTYIDSLHVSREVRNKDIGTNLIKDLIKNKCYLYTGLNNKPAISFYEKHGFTKNIIVPYMFGYSVNASEKKMVKYQEFCDGILMANYDTNEFGFGKEEKADD